MCIRDRCFTVQALDETKQPPVATLSRAQAQQMCKAEYLDLLASGDVLRARVTRLEPFGAFCDVGCGISALMPIDCMSVSRIQSPADRVACGPVSYTHLDVYKRQTQGRPAPRPRRIQPFRRRAYTQRRAGKAALHPTDICGCRRNNAF